jgi:hypothetical protein
MWRLRNEGRLTTIQHRRLMVASYNHLILEDGLAFVQLLRGECLQHLKSTTDADQWYQVLREWWDNLVEWLVENWDVVLKMALSLLVLLDKPETV